MGSAENPACSYFIDADDVLVSVDEEWLAFAKENAAPELTRGRVIGRPLWDFVEGERTRELYRELYERVRSRLTRLSVPFRCDAPDRYRFMRLELEPAAAGAIGCTGVLVREQTRVYLPILDQVLAGRAEAA